MPLGLLQVQKQQMLGQEKLKPWGFTGEPCSEQETMVPATPTLGQTMGGFLNGTISLSTWAKEAVRCLNDYGHRVHRALSTSAMKSS